MQQRAVRGRCVPYQEDLMERPRRRRLPDKRALVKQLLCSAKMASGNGVGTAPVAPRCPGSWLPPGQSEGLKKQQDPGGAPDQEVGAPVVTPEARPPRSW